MIYSQPFLQATYQLTPYEMEHVKHNLLPLNGIFNMLERKINNMMNNTH